MAMLSLPVRLPTLKRDNRHQRLRQRGWKIAALIILGYLVRDTLLYVVIPVLIARGLL